jgi:uncharacterized protein YjdB
MILSVACTMFASCSKDSDFVAVSRVDINKTTAAIPLGGTEQLSVRIYPDAAAATRSVRWFSDDTSIATIDGTGLIRALAVGMTVIRITDEDGKSYPATCAVSVHEQTVAVTGVSLVKATATVSVNGSEELNYTVNPLNATNKNVTWSSNNTAVATVDNNGKVTGISAGTATITVTAEDGNGKFSSSCAVTVQKAEFPVTGIGLNKTNTVISVNGAEQLYATIKPSNATNKTVIWSSSEVSVATVDENGTVTGVSVGAAIITATSAEDEGIAENCVVTVQSAAISATGVTLDKPTLTVTVDGTGQLTASVDPPNATNKNLVWSSSDNNVATVDATGLVTGVAAGAAGITATAEDGGFNVTCIVTVQNEVIHATGVTLDKPTLSITAGSTGQLTASIAPPNATNKNLVWSSSDNNVATVDATGLVTGVAAGAAGITATAEDGGFNVTCIVTVQSVDETIPATGVTLDKPTLTVIVGSTGQLTASVAPPTATNKNLVWSSSDNNVATVDATGLVTGVAAGAAGITATAEDGGFNVTCVVTVQAGIIPVTGIILNKSTSTISVNGYVELIATVSPPDATDKTVIWSSNATNVATVDAAGKVTGVAAGIATVTATAGGFAESCVVTVQSAAISVTGVTLDKSLLALQVGDIGTLTATVAPSEATDKSVSWTSSVPAVATVADGLVTALAAGTTTVTVKTVDGNFTQTCTVTVTAGGVTSTGWSAPAASSYEYSMTYVAQVAFGGELSTDTNVEIAAFVGSETAPRGHAKLIYESKLGVSLVYLTIFSNTSGGETVTLKAYNPSQQSIYNNCKTFTFQSDTSLGSTSEILNCFP